MKQHRVPALQLCPGLVVCALLRRRERLGVSFGGKARLMGCKAAYLPDLGMEYFFFDERLNEDRKSTRLNSSHVKISYAVFCLKKNIPRWARCSTGSRAGTQR